MTDAVERARELLVHEDEPANMLELIAALVEEVERLKIGPRCSITGNPCLSDTWAIGNPPDCNCGRLARAIDDVQAENDRLKAALECRNSDVQTWTRDATDAQEDRERSKI